MGLMRCQVGLGRRADIELQSPAALRAFLAAPQVNCADFGQPRVQLDRYRFGLPPPPRDPGNADLLALQADLLKRLTRARQDVLELT